ncbi:hypothetical protein MPSEU_000178700 [Mayamaea pseudoterrestris]|nr:hypothetical protein MPSEU_000178700 [Mayamaea pseudoterrestris]
MTSLEKIASSKAYHAAVSLNNAGIYLLSKGCLARAHQTFSDAMSVIKGIVDPEHVAGDVDHMLDQATRRMLDVKSDSTSFSARLVKIISCDPCASPCAAFLQPVFDPRFGAWTPIHIDLVEPRSVRTSPNIESAIILINVGITSYLMSKQEERQESSSRLRHLHNAIKFFEFAAHLSLQPKVHGQNEAIDGTEACRLVIAFHALRSIIQVLQLSRLATGMLVGKVGRYQRMYIDVRSRIIEWQAVSPIGRILAHGKFAAAA